MTENEIPDAFVWTKIQAEAGELIGRILARKELERAAGDGHFWWGIGESKGAAISLLRQCVTSPEVLFSLMRSAPHQRDSAPAAVVVWESYRTSAGEAAIPPHIIVTSRAYAGDGRLKSRHYALVCASPSSILSNGASTLNIAALRNVSGGKVGSSQITAVVEKAAPHGAPMIYPVIARAALFAPFFATLSSPRQLSDHERRLLDEIGVEGRGREDWIGVVRQIRRKR